MNCHHKYHIAFISLFHLFYNVYCLQKRELAWVTAGLSFEGLSKVWIISGTDTDCLDTNVRIAKCTAR